MNLTKNNDNSKDSGISILILTKDEELNLPDCLTCLEWADDIVVLDSYSSDDTEKIARSRGCRFIQRRFDNYAMQRNYGLNSIKYSHPWVLMIDADEKITAGLYTEIQTLLKNDDHVTHLFFMRRKDFFLGKWIKHSSGYPTWFGRLIRVGMVRVERAINEEYHTNGKKGYLKEHLLHYPFNKGMHSWFDKHNRYSTMEAGLMNDTDSSKIKASNLLTTNPVTRRKEIKRVVYKLPFRPLLVFCTLYILRGGFLDGYAGLKYCTLRCIYEYMIDFKSIELNSRKMLNRF